MAGNINNNNNNKTCDGSTRLRLWLRLYVSTSSVSRHYKVHTINKKRNVLNCATRETRWEGNRLTQKKKKKGRPVDLTSTPNHPSSTLQQVAAARCRHEQQPHPAASSGQDRPRRIPALAGGGPETADLIC